MSAPPAPLRPETASLLQRAAELEARGAWPEAITAWSSAAASDPSFLPARLGLAQALIRAGKPADALPLLGRISAAAPGVPAVWLALAVAQSMLGRHDLAVDNAKRAVALAPNVGALHSGLGDVLRQAGRLGDAANAYRKAVAKAPDDPDGLNKLSVIERALGRPDAAETLLRRAHARAQRHPYVRVNLGTLELELGHEAEGRALLQSSLADPSLPDDARSEASDALAMLDEHAALAAPLAEAIAQGSPAPIDAALRARPAAAARDEALVTFFADFAARLANAPAIDEMFPEGHPMSRSWPALEAHHNLRPGEGGAGLAHSVAVVAGREPPAGEAHRDLIHYARAVAARDTDPWRFHDATAWNAWLRWRHAQIVGHRPDLFPGQFKLINNLVANAPQVARTSPGSLAGTLAAIVDELLPRVAPGVWRAVFVYAAIGEMHPFKDANGRVARYLLNRLLIEAGRFPHLRERGGDDQLIAHLRATGDPAPLVQWLSAGSDYAAGLDREWLERESH